MKTTNSSDNLVDLTQALPESSSSSNESFDDEVVASSVNDSIKRRPEISNTDLRKKPSYVFASSAKEKTKKNLKSVILMVEMTTLIRM